jgi:hypothetical protein
MAGCFSKVARLALQGARGGGGLHHQLGVLLTILSRWVTAWLIS